MNPSHEPYLNSAKFADPSPKGHSGFWNIRPVMSESEGDGTYNRLGFSSYSSYSAGSKAVKPGVVVTRLTTDVDNTATGTFTYFSMSPFSISLDFTLGVGPVCVACSGTMYESCLGAPECTQVQTFTDSWNGSVDATYYGVSGQVIGTAPITATATLTHSSRDECPAVVPGSCIYELDGAITINHPSVAAFGGTMANISRETLSFGYSGIYEISTYVELASPIQYPYIDENKATLNVLSIGFLNSFSGTSGFSGFSGTSGFSGSTGCSGI